MPKVRAYGADATLLAARETSYGVLPLAGWRSLDFKSTDLSSSQPLGEDPLLGRGRNCQDPYRGLVTDEGQLEIPLDLRGTGLWLTTLFGDLAAVGGVEALDDLVDVDTTTAPPGSGDGLRWSGTAWVPSARGLDVGVFVPDRPAVGTLVFKLVVVRAFILPASLTDSRGHAGAAATALAAFELRKNGSVIGTASFAAGSQTASLTLASATSLAEGDRLELIAPTPQDTTLADLTILLKGSLA